MKYQLDICQDKVSFWQSRTLKDIELFGLVLKNKGHRNILTKQRKCGMLQKQAFETFESIDNKLFKWNLEYGILDVWKLFLRYEEKGRQTSPGRKLEGYYFH